MKIVDDTTVGGNILTKDNYSTLTEIDYISKGNDEIEGITVGIPFVAKGGVDYSIITIAESLVEK